MEGKRQSFRFCDWCLDIIIWPPRQCYQDIRGLFLVTPSTHCTRQQTGLGTMHCGEATYRNGSYIKMGYVEFDQSILNQWSWNFHFCICVEKSYILHNKRSSIKSFLPLVHCWNIGCQTCVDLVVDHNAMEQCGMDSILTWSDSSTRRHYICSSLRSMSDIQKSLTIHMED